MNKAIDTVGHGNAPVEIKKADLVAAWSVLENLAVSLDQIGGAFPNDDPGAGDHRLYEALSSYLSGDLWKEISHARTRLAKYLTEQEAQSLSDQIRYWEYKAPTK